MNCDEAGAGHVPVGVLQNQVQVVQVVQTCLENLGNALAFFEGQAGCGVVCECHDGLLHNAVMLVIRWGLWPHRIIIMINHFNGTIVKII